jgi:trimeric autotransporter adhesin
MARPLLNHRARMVRALLLSTFIVTLTVVPAFAQSGGPTRIEQDDASVTYSGNWYSNSSSMHSNGTAALTNTRGARATITFNGTGISWIGVKDNWSGLANVYLDGNMVVLDTYGNNAYQQTLYLVRGLPAGNHTLSIEVLHERNGQTSGSWVWIDAFIIENGSPVPGGVSAGGGRIQENHPALLFSGSWFSNSSVVHDEGRAALAMDKGSKVTIAFDGTGVSWIGYRDEWSGVARVYLDGVEKMTVDTYLAPSKPRTTLYTITNLAPGAHTLTIEATGARSESAKAAWIWVDAFDVVK